VTFSFPQNRMSTVVSNNPLIDNDPEYVRQQRNIIKDKMDLMYNGGKINEKPIINPIFEPHPLIDIQQKSMYDDSMSNRKNEYDPYLEYLNTKGLISDGSKVRYNVTYVNIDSSYRDKSPSITSSNTYTLDTDPLTISNDLLWISIPDHNLSINDKICLSGLTYKEKTIRTMIERGNVRSYGIEFTVGSKYAKIKTSPNISVTMLGTNAISYDTSNMYVDISGLKGNPIEAFIGNIPVNQLNKSQRVLLNIPNSVAPEDQPSESYFFIELPYEFLGISSITGYNVTLTFKYYGGINVNEINAEYPVSNMQLNGFHLVNSVDKNRVAIKLPRNGYYSGSFGGNNLHLKVIDQIITGYKDPNNYQISLGRTFNNVVQIRMSSSQFPNTNKVFRDYPEESRNNRLYFENIDDGNNVYMIELPSGNYDPSTLKTELESAFYATKKIFVDSSTSYTANNYIKVSINTNSNLVTFSSYKEAILTQPILEISPSITSDTNLLGGTFTITILQRSHGLSVGSKILISGCISHMGISADLLNTEQTVTGIIDANKYTITLSNINLQSSRVDTKGGYSVKIYVPNLFRMRFDYPDTMGNELGFRNVGDSSSITNYGYVISNADLYQDEITTDELGNTINVTNNHIMLSGESYILMTCRELDNIINTSGKITNIFAKINLTGIPGRMLYDTFVSSPIFFYDPLISLSRLTFSFYDSSGNLFDFNGIDHSFVLEIVTLDNYPLGTGISATSGLVH